MSWPTRTIWERIQHGLFRAQKPYALTWLRARLFTALLFTPNTDMLWYILVVLFLGALGIAALFAVHLRNQFSIAMPFRSQEEIQAKRDFIQTQIYNGNDPHGIYERNLL